MLCPIDSVQMHQFKNIGGGEANDTRYVTWELKICPVCKRLVKEYYAAIQISEDQIQELLENSKT